MIHSVGSFSTDLGSVCQAIHLFLESGDLVLEVLEEALLVGERGGGRSPVRSLVGCFLRHVVLRGKTKMLGGE